MNISNFVKNISDSLNLNPSEVLGIKTYVGGLDVLDCPRLDGTPNFYSQNFPK